MSTLKKHCAVRNCSGFGPTRHRFPNPKKDLERFKKWIEACDSPKLCTVAPDHVYYIYRVCQIHFTPKDRSSNMFLNRQAVPTLHLPVRAIIQEENQDDSIEIENADIVEVDSQPSTSGRQIVLENVELMEPEISAVQLNESQPSTSKEGNIDRETVTGRSPILRRAGVTRITQLTPRCKSFYRNIVKFKKENRQLQARNATVKRRLKYLENMTEDEIIDDSTSGLSPTVAEFIRSRLKLQGRKDQGKRYSWNDKIIGLVLYKQSRGCYNFLSKLFSLPKRSTLMSVLKKIPIEAGINDVIFNNLHSALNTLPEKDRYCVLMFDEMSLDPHLNFNKSSGIIEGFQDLGDTRSNLLADHALLFMLRGVVRNWKQPICFYFSKGPVKRFDLVRIIKHVITRCQESLANIVATISDQGTSNTTAVNYLMKDTKASYLRTNKCYNETFFEVNGKKIFHVYDPPHLLKGIRNNLLSKDLIMMHEGKEVVAKWSHVEAAYACDNSATDFRSMPKLTEFHVNKKKIKKMKVSIAAQVFSHNVSSVMQLMATSGTIGPDGTRIPVEATETAAVLNFFNKLFDSVNGHNLRVLRGNILRCGVTANSAHQRFWASAKKTLSNMHFVDPETFAKLSVPSLKNWIHTLTSLEELSKELRLQGITFILPRKFNQDPVENFFGQIRQHGCRNVNPTCSLFKSHFKTLLLNNLALPHSLGANCEADETANVIASVKQFVGQNITTVQVQSIDLSRFNFIISSSYKSFIDKISIGYVGGWLAKNIKTLNQCEICKRNLICQTTTEWHDLVVAREFSDGIPNKLRYCTPKFLSGLALMYDIIKKEISAICHEKLFYCILIKLLKNNVEFQFEHCEHTEENIENIFKQFSFLCIFNWCGSVNKIIHGKERKARASNVIFSQAIDIFNKRQRRHQFRV